MIYKWLSSENMIDILHKWKCIIIFVWSDHKIDDPVSLAMAMNEKIEEKHKFYIKLWFVNDWPHKTLSIVFINENVSCFWYDVIIKSTINFH
jgi:hypothetical protein